MMDRDYKDKLPAMQVEFIDTICLPVYTNLVKLSDNLQPMLHGKLIPYFRNKEFGEEFFFFLVKFHLFLHYFEKIFPI